MRTLEELKKERIRIYKECQDEWSDGLEMILNELLNDHFCGDYTKVISFYESLNEKEMYFFSEELPDIIEKIPNLDLLNYFESLPKKFPTIDFTQELQWAHEAYENFKDQHILFV